MFSTQYGRTILGIAAAICLTAIAAPAQTGQWPWQVSVRRTATYDANSGKLFIDLPMPPAGRILTVEQISVSVGPLLSIYGKVHQCEIEAARLGIEGDGVQPTTRVLLPFPEWLSPNTNRTRAIVSSPVRMHVENGISFTRSLQFRLSCDAENVGSETMAVTLVGYTTPKQ